MNLSPALFHGVQVLVALALAAIIVVICAPLVFYVWLRHTKSSEHTLAFTYGVTTAVLCLLTALTLYDPLSLFHLTVFSLAGILTLPWNIITVVAISMGSDADVGDGEVVATMVLGAAVNTMLLFFLAKKARGFRV